MSEEKKKRSELSPALKRFFGVGDAGFSLMACIETYYFQYFLTNVAMFSMPEVSLISTIYSGVDAALSWVYGIMLNTIKPMKWGRYRSWLIVIPWVVPIFYAFMFFKVGTGALAVTVICVGAIISHICWNIPFVANMTMISVASKTPEDRAILSSSRTTWGSVARIAYSYVGPFVVSVISGALGEQYGYAGCAFAFGCLMVAGYAAHFFMFDGYEETPEEEAKRMAAQRAAQGADSKSKGPSLWDALKVNPYIVVFIIASCTAAVGTAFSTSFAVYYWKYVAKNPGLMSVYLLTSNFVAVVVSYSARKIIAKLGAKKTLLYAYGAVIIAMVMVFLTHRMTPYITLMLMCIYQAGYTMSGTCSPVIYSDCTIYSEYVTGKNAAGAFMGLSNISIKVPIMIKGILIAGVLSRIGFDASAAEMTAAQITGIATSFTMVTIGFVAVGAAILFLFYKLDADKVAEYSAAIAQRKATAEANAN